LGLIHGFGFATTLGALQFWGTGFVSALIGFNLGLKRRRSASFW